MSGSTAPGNAVNGGDDPVVTVDEVSHSFGETTVLEDVSFHLSENSATAIVGPNGSGKTTLAEIVAGFLEPTEGRVDVHTEADRPVGYLPQSPRFHPVLTVRETVEYYASFLGTDVSLDETLGRVGLAPVSDRQVGDLSGGMVRLLGIAQALLGSPPVVVLDEPTSDLDPGMTAHVVDIVTNAARSGTSVLLTTHDLSSVAEIDRMCVLDGGQIVADGSPSQLVERHESADITDAFLSIVGPERTVQPGGEETGSRTAGPEDR